jgi:hypothetical protein
MVGASTVTWPRSPSMREGLLAASTAVGLEVMAELIELEVTEPVGPKGRHDPDRTATRYGTEPGSVMLGGRRVSVRRPRVRTVARDGQRDREIIHASYATFASIDLLAEGDRRAGAGRDLHAAVPVALEPVGSDVEHAASSTSKSAVSRRFVTATAERLASCVTAASMISGGWWCSATGSASVITPWSVRWASPPIGTKAPLGWWRDQPRTARCVPA